MARPPHARERVLDAFEALLISDGERAATLDAVARAAGVSKGGLLYHFASKDELSAAMIVRLHRLAEDDVARIRSAPEGAVEYYLRTSVMMDDALDRAIIAVSRMAQGGNDAAILALHRMRDESAAAIRPHVRDQAALDLVMLLSDGLFFNNTLDADGSDGVVPAGAALDALITLVRGAVEPDLGVVERGRRSRPPTGSLSEDGEADRPTGSLSEDGEADRDETRRSSGDRVSSRSSLALRPRSTTSGRGAQTSVSSIWRNRSASIATRTSSRSTSGIGESSVSTLSAWPPAVSRAICMPAMLIPASPKR